MTILHFFTLLALCTIVIGRTDNRIVGGRPAQEGEFPYQASLKRSYSDQHFCGASVITARHIVTAAHCMFYMWGAVLPPTVVSVTVGQVGLGMQHNSTYRNVSMIVVHPGYNSKTMANDLAVLELKEPLPLDGRSGLISGVPLNDVPVSLLQNARCVVTGWGVEDYQTGQISKSLLVAEVHLLSHAECQRRYNYMDITIFGGMLCASNDKVTADACQGDSGGPLVCEGRLVGLVSTGIGCGEPEFPGVYNDIQYFLPWIRSIIYGEAYPTESATHPFTILNSTKLKLSTNTILQKLSTPSNTLPTITSKSTSDTIEGSTEENTNSFWDAVWSLFPSPLQVPEKQNTTLEHFPNENNFNTASSPFPEPTEVTTISNSLNTINFWNILLSILPTQPPEDENTIGEHYLNKNDSTTVSGPVYESVTEVTNTNGNSFWNIILSILPTQLLEDPNGTPENSSNNSNSITTPSSVFETTEATNTNAPEDANNFWNLLLSILPGSNDTFTDIIEPTRTTIISFEDERSEAELISDALTTSVSSSNSVTLSIHLGRYILLLLFIVLR